MKADEYFDRISGEAKEIARFADVAKTSSGAQTMFGEKLERFANFITFWPSADDPRYKRS